MDTLKNVEHVSKLQEIKTNLQRKMIERAKKLEDEKNLRIKKSEEYRKKVEDVISFLAHELRNSLNGILFSIRLAKEFIERMEENPVPRDIFLKEMTDRMQELLECSNHQKAVLSEVIPSLKNDSQAFDPIGTATNFDLIKTMNDIETIFKPVTTTKSLLMAFYWVWKDPKTGRCIRILQHDLLQQNKSFMISGAFVQYKQLVLNFVSNATKYTRKGKIEVIMTVEDEFKELQELDNQTQIVVSGNNSSNQTQNLGRFTLKVDVCDTGIGMTEEQVRNIFKSERRFQSEMENPPDDSILNSSGLGLFIAKQIADKLKGNIAVDSKRGKGTRITLSIPFRKTDPEFQYSSLFQAKLFFFSDIDQISKKLKIDVLKRKLSELVYLHFERMSQIRTKFLEFVSRIPPPLTLSSPSMKTYVQSFKVFEYLKFLASSLPIPGFLETSCAVHTKPQLSVLVVEDNYINRKVLEHMLAKAYEENYDLEVVPAKDGKDGLDKYKIYYKQHGRFFDLGIFFISFILFFHILFLKLFSFFGTVLMDIVMPLSLLSNFFHSFFLSND